MPTLVDRLQSMMTAIEQQSLALNERQIASQDAFHGKTEATYTRLASSVEQSLKESVAESARAAGAALQPVMEATMAGLARETAVVARRRVTHAVQRQLDGLSSGFEATHHDRGRNLEAGTGRASAIERGAVRAAAHVAGPIHRDLRATLGRPAGRRLRAPGSHCGQRVRRRGTRRCRGRNAPARSWRATTSKLWPRRPRPSSSIRRRCCAPWASRMRTCRRNWHRATNNGSRPGPRRSVRWPLR